MAQKINKAGLDLIKKFEGLRTDAYLCPAGIWTIGYGHTSGVVPGQKVTEQKAEQFLLKDVEDAETAVKRYIDVDLMSNEFSALVCFTFNLGSGNLRTSTLRRKLNAGDKDCVPSELARWVKSGGKTLSGLVRRRAAEGELFLLPDGVSASAGIESMPQRVESVDSDFDARFLKPYLRDDTILELGSVDDIGDANYIRLSQNVPDGYVTGLQDDLKALGLADVGTSDGAFGKVTRRAVKNYQELVGIPVDGTVDRDTKDKIMVWLEQGFTVNQPPDKVHRDSLVLPAGFNMITPRVPHYSQGDERWARRMLGIGSSIRREGCAISCVAMILSFYGREVTPMTLDKYLDKNDGYHRNSVKWGVAGKCGASGSSPKLKYERNTKKPLKLASILSKRIERNLPTMVRVDYAIDSNLSYDHFVVCVGKAENGDFVMNDPATRKGDGYENMVNDNIIQRTRRKSGYSIVQLDYYDPKQGTGAN